MRVLVLKHFSIFDLSDIFNALIINHLVFCFFKNVQGKNNNQNFSSIPEKSQKSKKIRGYFNFYSSSYLVIHY